MYIYCCILISCCMFFQNAPGIQNSGLFFVFCFIVLSFFRFFIFFIFFIFFVFFLFSAFTFFVTSTERGLGFVYFVSKLYVRHMYVRYVHSDADNTKYSNINFHVGIICANDDVQSSSHTLSYSHRTAIFLMTDDRDGFPNLYLN